MFTTRQAMYVSRNTEVQSCNNCLDRRTKNITYFNSVGL